MHYSKTAFGNGKVTLARKGCPNCQLGQHNGFTKLDLKELNDLYGCSKDDIGTSTDPPETCEKEDLNVNCPSWKNQGFCNGQYEQYMKDNCFKSCYCSGKDIETIICVDLLKLIFIYTGFYQFYMSLFIK